MRNSTREVGIPSAATGGITEAILLQGCTWTFPLQKLFGGGTTAVCRMTARPRRIFV